MKSNFIVIGALIALISFVSADVSEKDGTQPASEEPVQKVHVLNPGEKEYLSPNLIGLQNIAVTNIPVTMDFINIIDAFREVVDGVKYEIVLNAVNTTDNNTEIVCRLVVLEKPWLTTLWGDKVRLLQESNCTNEEIKDTSRDRKSLEEKYETNAIFTGSRNELTADDMSNLESQILSSSKPLLTRQRTTTTTTESIVVAEPEHVTEPVIIAEPTVPTTDIQSEANTSSDDNAGTTVEEHVVSSTEPSVSTTTSEKIPELNDDEKKWLDDFLSVGAYNFETSLQNKKSQSANNEAQLNGQEADKREKRGLVGGARQLDEQELKLAEESFAKSLSKVTTGDGPSYTIVKVYSGTVQVVAGSLTKFDVDLLDGATGKTERCTVSIWEQPWVKKDGNEMTFDCKDKPTDVHRYTRSVDEVKTIVKRQIGAGGARQLSKTELQQKQREVSASFAKLASGSGPSYRLVKIFSGTTQVVAGTLDKLDAELVTPSGKTERCTLSIVSQPWLPNGNEITIACKGQPTSVHRVSRSVGNEKVKTIVKRQIPGGARQLSNTELQQKQREVSASFAKLASGSGPSYRLVKIFSGTTQVVAGTLDKLDAELVTPSGKTERCTLSIVSQPWLPNGNEITIACKGQPTSVHRVSRSVDNEKVKTIVKRQIPGGARQLSNTELQQKQREVSASFAKLASGSGPSYRLVKIFSGTTQVVAGTLDKLDAELVTPSGKTERCTLSIVSQPWLPNGNEITIACKGQPTSVHRVSRSVDNEKVKTIAKRQIGAGGARQLSKTELQQKQSEVSASFAKLASGSGPSYRLVKIFSGTTQVVAGTLDKLDAELVTPSGKTERCTLSIVSQPWLPNGNEITIACKGQPTSVHRVSRSVDNVKAEFRAKRAPTLVGGARPLNDEELKKQEPIISQSLTKIAAGDGPNYSLFNLISGTIRIVSGTDVVVKAEIIDEASGEKKLCNLSLWSQPWLTENGYQLTIDCEDKPKSVQPRSKRALAGAPKSLNADELKEQGEKISASMAKLEAGDGPSYSLSKLYSGTRQIVAGTLVKVDAELIDGSTGNKVNCTVTLWSRPWIPVDGYEVTFECNDKPKSVHRHSRSVEYAQKKSHKKNHRSLDKAEHLFQKFQTKYTKKYHSTMERQMRLRIFKHNLKLIQDLNKHEMGSAKYGITEFADMTTTEYRERTGLMSREESNSVRSQATIPDVELPKEFDWREKGVISQVKNQGNCGSCWAFSVTGNIEGLHAVQTGKLEEYSEQELLDCDTVDSACQGGLPDNAYQAIEKIGGLELESEYPYEAKKGRCHYNSSLTRVKLSGAVDLPKNETAMAQWLITNGPISIGINANAMQFYRGGVSHPWKVLCAKNNLDHGVLIVGYGVSDYPMFKKTLPYWIVKNSWGPKWGEQGYYRVYRGDNTCGVSEMATSAILANIS